jgi:RNA polymerase sigma-70 factor (family 1)
MLNKYINISIEHFIHSFSKGDTSTFPLIFKEFYPSLVAYANRIVNEDYAAEEVVQQCFIKLWERKPRVDGVVSFKAYLYRMVHNACMDHLKREHRSSEQLFNLPNEKQEKSHLENMIRSETLRELYAAINELPKECGKVVRMYFEEGQDTEAIARKLGISVNTVRNQKRKGIGLLKKRFLPLLLIALFSSFIFFGKIFLSA